MLLFRRYLSFYHMKKVYHNLLSFLPNHPKQIPIYWKDSENIAFYKSTFLNCQLRFETETIQY